MKAHNIVKEVLVLLLTAALHSSPVTVFCQGQTKYKRPRTGSGIKRDKVNSPTARAGSQSKNEPQLVLQLGHSWPVYSAAFSSDGRFIVTGSKDKTARLWDTATGKELRSLRGHMNEISSVSVSPDSQIVLTASTGNSRSADEADLTVRLWDVTSGKELKRYKAPEADSVTFSPDGKFILLGCSDGITLLWDSATGREVRRFKVDGEENVKSAVFSPDGRSVLIGSADNTAYVWDVRTGRLKRRIKGGEFSFGRVTFSPDARYILAGDGFVFTDEGEYKAELWDADTGTKVREFGPHSAGITAVAFSPDGQKALTGSSDSTACLWEVATGRMIWKLEGHGARPGMFAGGVISSGAFSPDGRLVITAGWDNTARVWDVVTGKELYSLEGSSSGVRALALSSQTELLLSSDNEGQAHLWDLISGVERKTVRVDSGPTFSSALSPDSRSIIAAGSDRVARLWDIDTGSELRAFRVKGEKSESDDVSAIAFSPNGFLVATGHASGLVVVWDAATGQEVQRLTGHSRSITSLAFSPDGRQLLSGGYDNTARLWNTSTGEQVYLYTARSSFKSTYVSAVAYSPDGKTALIGSKDIIYPRNYAILVDLETKARIPAPTFHHDSGGIEVAAFSPDGSHFLTGGENGVVKVFNVDLKELSLYGTVRKTLELKGHSISVTSAAFSHDGRFVITGSLDQTLRWWDVSSGQELCRLISLRDGGWAVVTPEGRFDTNDLEEIKGLHWVMPDDPMKPLPLEIFMRDYYEPRLLPRILSGEDFGGTRKLSDLNRVQPSVRITGIERREDKSDLVTVTVEISKARSERQRDKNNKLRETGVYDLRLFRDGQIVGQYTDGKPQSLSQSASDNNKLLAWQKENEIKLDADGKRTIKFENIKLPQSAGRHEVQFTAYAFNEDRVKSETAKTDKPFSYEVTKEKGHKGRAYVISVGVNAYENLTFDLRYSVNDARAIQKTIFDRLSQTGDYADIVQVPLISDYQLRLADKSIPSHEATKEQLAAGERIVTSQSATKSNLKAVLDVLAGRSKPSELPDSLPDTERLRKQLQQANPEDLVLISFSSHGYADSDGNFFVVLSDTGPGTSEEVTEALLQKLSPKFLSSEELSLWLRDVDGGEMMIIIDACHSGAIGGKEFKPGPMGSRGLGQLSYDKGMRILAATQAADVAYGIGALKQGLLTYTLVKDGIEAGKADFKPADKQITVSEWLQYGEQGVPKLLEEIGNKAKHKEAAVELKDLVQKTSADLKSQRPSLFDFSRKRRDVLLVGK